MVERRRTNGDLARNRKREPIVQIYNGVRRILEFEREPVKLEGKNRYFEETTMERL